MESVRLSKQLMTHFGELTDRQLMGLTIYGEARGESRAGRVAIGSVILERVEHRNWDGNTIQEVCLKPYQFSCFLPNDPNYPKLRQIAENWFKSVMSDKALNDCYALASNLIDKMTPRNSMIKAHHVLQYKTKDCDAGWAKSMKLITIIGNHQFYA